MVMTSSNRAAHVKAGFGQSVDAWSSWNADGQRAFDAQHEVAELVLDADLAADDRQVVADAETA